MTWTLVLSYLPNRAVLSQTTNSHQKRHRYIKQKGFSGSSLRMILRSTLMELTLYAFTSSIQSMSQQLFLMFQLLISCYHLSSKFSISEWGFSYARWLGFENGFWLYFENEALVRVLVWFWIWGSFRLDCFLGYVSKKLLIRGFWLESCEWRLGFFFSFGFRVQKTEDENRDWWLLFD